jgi:hypothetical protein
MMTPADLLAHYDTGRLWPAASVTAPDVPAAYQQQLALRQLRQARGEIPRGFKIGFTNRGIWPRYNVYAPIWGSVWDTTLVFGEAAGTLSLAGSCQPRIEPETVFGLRATPCGQRDRCRTCGRPSIGSRPDSRSCRRTDPTGSSPSPTRLPMAACTFAWWWAGVFPCANCPTARRRSMDLARRRHRVAGA